MGLYRSTAELEAALDAFRASPPNNGRLDLIVRRPAVDDREVLVEGYLDVDVGLVGDSWSARPSSRNDGRPHPDMQLNIINARLARFLAFDDEQRAALAGDQLHVDLDLSASNVPPGTRLHIGEAVIEVTDQPHTGCQKFSQRFGVDALRFVNSAVGTELHLRGVNARVVTSGAIRRGDTIAVVRATEAVAATP